jgi:diacylglycerol kinase (ATP)
VVREREPILFVINPFSGAKRTKGITEKIEKSFQNSRFKALMVFTEKPGSAYEITKKHIGKKINKVFAVGGDGTVNEVAKALINKDVTLGIIPIGSGNGLARHLRIPLDVSKAAKLVYKQKIALIDYGLANDNPFFCTSGVGFDAFIAKKFDDLSNRGLPFYAKTVLNEFFNYKPALYKLQDNGYSVEKEAFLITVANASQFGYNAFIAPEADITDGLLDVTVISPFPKYLVPSIGLKLINRNLGKSRYVEMFRVKELSIEAQSPTTLHLDGETSLASGKILYKIQPLGLKVFVP